MNNEIEVFGELTSLPNVKFHYIESENPDHHWNFLQVENEIVLDLGCGLHLIEGDWLSTPEYFLQKKAKKIIGVDIELNDINHFKTILPDQSFYCDQVNSVEKIDYYINENNVTALKMDIEGDEVSFLNSSSDYPTLKYVAIETHSRQLMHQIVQKLLHLNFDINILCTFYPRVFEVCNLIYASRK